jgi:hypothetical protein
MDESSRSVEPGSTAADGRWIYRDRGLVDADPFQPEAWLAQMRSAPVGGVFNERSLQGRLRSPFREACERLQRAKTAERLDHW